ncbi:sensor histidine kinase [Salinibacterium sp. ZJ450]|uniref:sensor histidine kinase n=1 Tax=Salinibacterium sp. ZJ450 TaxID=2708338 RepID=UPI00141E21AC|nr:sensor histidine kinase [Salinibacterium sp. ZJ450]
MIRALKPYQYVVDGVLALLFALLFWQPSVMQDATPVWPVLIVLYAIAVGLRRVSPGLALGIAWIGAILQMVGDILPNLHNGAILLVLFTTAAYGTRLVRWLGLASVGVGAATAALYLVLKGMALGGSGTLLGWTGLPELLLQFGLTFAAMLAVLGLPWLAGLLLMAVLRNREASRARRAAEETVVVEQERNRIARDMHDVVAHSLAVVIAQADGARYVRQTDPDAVDTALTAISSTAREALADVRVLLGQLRHSQGDAPQPGLGDLDRLIDQLRAAGLTIDAAEHGDPGPLSTAHQLAVYRITQEALTNALRHGELAEPVRLTLTWHVDSVELEVQNACQGTQHAAETRLGHGLAGMRERATLVGGRLTAGAIDGRFRVNAEIPFTQTAQMALPTPAQPAGPTQPAVPA